MNQSRFTHRDQFSNHNKSAPRRALADITNNQCAQPRACADQIEYMPPAPKAPHYQGFQYEPDGAAWFEDEPVYEYQANREGEADWCLF